MGDGGLCPPTPITQAQQCVHPSSGTGLGQGLGGLCPPCPCIPLGCTRWVGCIATQPKQSDAKAKQCLGVALLCNAEGGGGRALLRNATSGPYPREACPREAYGMQGLCIVLITGLRNQPFVVHEYFS